MEFTKPDEEDLIRWIGEIKAYYDAWETANGGSPTISRSMLAFTAGIERAEDVDSLLELLDQRGAILSRQGELIRLSGAGFQVAVP